MGKSLVLVACIGVLAPSLFAQGADLCGPSTDVQAALDRVPGYQTADQFEYDFLQARRSAMLALRQRYPGDVFVQRAYIGMADRAKLTAEYKTLYDGRPDDADRAYLYGMTLAGRDTPRAIQLFTAALEKSPSFPWPHLQLVSIYSSPNFQDKAKAIAHAKAFLSACPAAMEGYSLVSALADNDLTRPAASQLRSAIEPRTDAGALGEWPTLWSFEFALHPPSEYDALRKRVAADVAHLRALNLEDVRQWWEALQEGYQLTNDGKQSDWAAGQGARRFPSNRSLPERTRWYEDRKFPGLDAPIDQRRAYDKDMLKQTDAWIKVRPNSYTVWFDRLRALEGLDDSPNAEVEACIAKLLAIAQADKGPEPLDVVTDFQLLFPMENRKLQPQRQLELAQKALERLTAEAGRSFDDRFISKAGIEAGMFSRTNLRFLAYFYEAEAYVRLQQAIKAQETLAQADAALEALKAQAGGKDELHKTCAREESLYWLAEARLSELRGGKLDAMACYERALLARLDSGSVPVAGEKDDLAQDAHQLWASLGGSEESWKLWYTSRAEAVTAQSNVIWEETRVPLPSFQLADLQGKTWGLADLKGKVTLLNFWATWCGPCRTELPHFQKLAEQYKDRKDVVFLSLNIDDNPGIVGRFLTEQKLSLNVLPANSYASDTLKLDVVPQNWIVGRDGVIRMKGMGSYNSLEKWEQSMKDAIEKVLASDAIPGPR